MDITEELVVSRILGGAKAKMSTSLTELLRELGTYPAVPMDTNGITPYHLLGINHIARLNTKEFKHYMRYRDANGYTPAHYHAAFSDSVVSPYDLPDWWVESNTNVTPIYLYTDRLRVLRGDSLPPNSLPLPNTVAGALLDTVPRYILPINLFPSWQQRG